MMANVIAHKKMKLNKAVRVGEQVERPNKACKA
jgi:hypothetical protein